MEKIWPSLSNINQRQLHRATDSSDDAITWCKEHGLLPTKKYCHTCGGKMKEILKQNDGFRWRCKVASCKTERAMKEGTCFENSKLDIVQILDLMYAYSFETANIKNLERECEMSKVSIVKWRNYVRSIYIDYFARHPLKIGGPGHVVEIDESAFVRRKDKTQWLFAGLDTGTQEGFLVAVEKRDAKALLSIIEEYVLPGSIVVSALWKSYGIIDELGYRHLNMNHNINFVDPLPHTKLNHVESLMSRAKERNKRECGTHQELLPSYLTEFMWRQKFGNDPFQKLIEQIREIYPV